MFIKRRNLFVGWYTGMRKVRRARALEIQPPSTPDKGHKVTDCARCGARQERQQRGS